MFKEVQMFQFSPFGLHPADVLMLTVQNTVSAEWKQDRLTMPFQTNWSYTTPHSSSPSTETPTRLAPKEKEKKYNLVLDK